MMHDDTFTPEEQAMIDWLRNLPRPQLKPEAYDAIQQRLMAELDAPPVGPVDPPPTHPGLPISLLVAVAIVLLGVAAVITAASILGPSLTATLSPTATVQPSPTATLGSTVTAAPSVQPTVRTAPTLAPPPQPTLASTEPAAQEPIIVVEGPVQQIKANIITIFDMEIQLDPRDPILGQIQPGKTIRVEGRQQADGKVIVAVKVTVLVVGNPGNPNNPPAGEPPPGCKWTGKGNNRLQLKCSKKSSRR